MTDSDSQRTPATRRFPYIFVILALFAGAVVIDSLITRNDLTNDLNTVVVAQLEPTRAIQISPDNASAYYNRGYGYYLSKDYPLALADLDLALQLDNTYVDAYYLRALMHYDLQEYEQALRGYQRIIELDPNYAVAYWGRGVIYAIQNRKSEAVADYLRYQELTGEIEPFMQTEMWRYFFSEIFNTNQ